MRTKKNQEKKRGGNRENSGTKGITTLSNKAATRPKSPSCALSNKASTPCEQIPQGIRLVARSSPAPQGSMSV
jgi:hypothetical protein